MSEKVVAKLKGMDKIDPTAYAQAYLESRGYLKGPLAADTRMIQPVAAFVLLGRHAVADANRPLAADAKPMSLLLHFAVQLEDLRRAMTNPTSLVDVTKKYQAVQDLSQELSTRELLIARITARIAALGLLTKNQFEWEGASVFARGAAWVLGQTTLPGAKPDVDSLLEKAEMNSATTADAIWKPLVAAMRKEGKPFVQWESIKTADYGSSKLEPFSPEAKAVQQSIAAAEPESLEW